MSARDILLGPDVLCISTSAQILLGILEDLKNMFIADLAFISWRMWHISVSGYPTNDLNSFNYRLQKPTGAQLWWASVDMNENSQFWKIKHSVLLETVLVIL